MSDTILTIEQAAQCLPDVVERVHSTGKAALLMKAGQPVARIVPVAPLGNNADDLIALLRQWRNKYPEPDDGFADAIEESRQAVQPAHDPWE